MPQMVARSHKRYALNLPVQLKSSERRKGGTNGLMVEVSQHFARISQLESNAYQPGDIVTLKTPCDKTRNARIRWTRATIAGVRFEEALRLPELSDWLSTRGGEAGEADLRYA